LCRGPGRACLRSPGAFEASCGAKHSFAPSSGPNPAIHLNPLTTWRSLGAFVHHLTGLNYRLRWEVETFFKTAKTGSGLPELPSRKQHIVETLLYASLLRATTSMQALARFRREVGDILGLAINPGQWQRWWNRQLHHQLQRLVYRVGHLSDDTLAHMLADPNVGRPTNRHTFLAAGYAW